MKNQWIRTSTVLLLATTMLIGINAQNAGGKGMGPKGQNDRTGYCQADRPGFHQADRPGYRQDHGLNFLNLSEEQKEELSSLRLEHYKNMKPLRAEMGELKARERTLMSQEEIDVKSLNNLIDERTSLLNSMQKIQLNHRLAVREILSDEQLMQLDQSRTPAFKRAGRRTAITCPGRHVMES